MRCGTLVDGTGAPPQHDMDIVIDGSRIASIRHQSDFPPSGTVVDGRDYTVIPGLIDAHDHLGFDMGDEHAQTLESDVWTSIKATHNARRCLQSGITTLRDVGEKHHLDIFWRDALSRGLMVGPRLLIAGQFLTITGGHAWYAGVEVDDVADVKRAVRSEAKHGVDLIKLMVTGGAGTKGTEPLSPAFSEDEIKAAVSEAARLGLPVAVHAYGGPAIRWCVEAGVRSIEHGSFCTDDELALMAERDCFLVATVGVIQAVSVSPDVPAHMREKCKEIAEVYMNTLVRAKSAGVRVAIGTDGNHARLDTEMSALREAGFSGMEVVQAATLTGAAVCKLEDQVGSIEAGKVADLVALEGDPIQDVRSLERVRWVIHEGQMYQPESLA